MPHPLRAEAPMLLAATLAQSLPGAPGQVATAGALLLLAFRLYWRALRGAPPPLMPGAPFLAFMIRVGLALGVWVMLVSLGFVGLKALLPEAPALIGAALLATPLTLALAVTGLAPPLLPADTPRPGLLAALRPPALHRSALWLLLLVLPACGLALAARLLLPGLLAAAALSAALALTILTLAHLWRCLAPPRPGAAIFA
ncbi:MAG: hypothetical protein JNN06_16090 [Gemmobacter sp.]|uniref:hypothetical protein n=1 Tax=Gemmobacter sp. TaxID=1898957 RepID=UPI001A4AFB4A|nr:hypothetical protein [Gemmobacter sp.]MBL8563791.1 hypothetical protein [Gemmobacter sp.]